MNRLKNTASIKEVTEQLESLDIPRLFKYLVHYALGNMRTNSMDDAEKIVADVFEKTARGVRKWNKDHSFISFLRLAVKSLVSQYNNKSKDEGFVFNHEIELDTLAASDSDDSTVSEELKNALSEKLRENIPPPDIIEEMIFECWMDGMKKPREIVEFLEVDITEVRKAIKRLKRKLNPIRELLESRII